MAKNSKDQKQESIEMSAEDARALRLAKHNAIAKQPTEKEKREEFRVFWAQEKSKYGRDKELEEVLWLHLRAVGMDLKEDFKKGLAHFGLKQIR